MLLKCHLCSRAPSPPAKRRKHQDETDEKISAALIGEIARLDRRFRVKLDPLYHSGSKSVHLVCSLGKSCSCPVVVIGYWTSSVHSAHLNLVILSPYQQTPSSAASCLPYLRWSTSAHVAAHLCHHTSRPPAVTPHVYPISDDQHLPTVLPIFVTFPTDLQQWRLMFTLFQMINICPRCHPSLSPFQQTSSSDASCVPYFRWSAFAHGATHLCHHTNRPPAVTPHVYPISDDQHLPTVPPISVTIPENYPETSPTCSPGLEDYGKAEFDTLLGFLY